MNKETFRVLCRCMAPDCKFVEEAEGRILWVSAYINVTQQKKVIARLVVDKDMAYVVTWDKGRPYGSVSPLVQALSVSSEDIPYEFATGNQERCVAQKIREAYEKRRGRIF